MVMSKSREGFQILEHTADAGVTAYGQDLGQAFANAAAGLFSLIIDLDRVRESLRRDIVITAPGIESLLVEWLNELIYIFDVDNLLFKRFEIAHIDSTSLRARCYGERVDLSRHRLKTGVKAATYHLLKVERHNSGYRAQVIFDI
jgi:SHS2 domain-containing protein